MGQVKIEGLAWGEGHKVMEVAYGVQKLIISAVIEDEKVTDAHPTKCCRGNDHLSHVDLWIDLLIVLGRHTMIKKSGRNLMTME